MTEYTLLALGAMAALAAWDVGRRFADRNASRLLLQKVAALESRVEPALSVRDDVEELREQIAALGSTTANIKNHIESTKAPRRAPWPVR